VYVSATPADYELEKGKDALVEQIARPTGLIDPEIEIRSATNQVDDLYEEIISRQKKDERVLVTTLTKRMAEDLTEYYSDLGIKVRYLHADIKTLERMDIIKDLRTGSFNVLIGINLLREGLDIPEVSLVAILDADKEGFLRSTRSLIQTCGRASRNINGKVIMYAENITKSMKEAINETNRRRKIQEIYNDKHNITPESIKKEITEIFSFEEASDTPSIDTMSEDIVGFDSLENLDDIIKSLEKEMKKAAKALKFEEAAVMRDKIKELRELIVFDNEISKK
ncbi:MAG: UvrB/UvrC motif-containing protein, partial [Deltaproteobacteria bacterium]|nr:UvrB/UvrC motif-containing protein [Deltaproteobacteria bacterium]